MVVTCCCKIESATVQRVKIHHGTLGPKKLWDPGTPRYPGVVIGMQQLFGTMVVLGHCPGIGGCFLRKHRNEEGRLENISFHDS